MRRFRWFLVRGALVGLGIVLLGSQGATQITPIPGGSGLGQQSPCANGEILKTDTGVWECAADASGGAGGTPGGSDTQCQYNDAGAFGGDPGCTYNETTNVLTVTGGVVANVTGNASGTAGSLAANGANCSAGQAPLGVSAAGAVESCFDVATQVELDAHTADPTDAHAGTAIGYTPAGDVAATTVSGAIGELDTEKAAATDPRFPTTNEKAGLAANTPTAANPVLTAAELAALLKTTVRVAATTNITLGTPGATIDDISLSAADRVLLTAQTAALENGIYVWNGAASAMTRAADANTSAEFVPGFMVAVLEGTLAAGSSWRFTNTAVPTLDTTALVFSRGSSASLCPGGPTALTACRVFDVCQDTTPEPDAFHIAASCAVDAAVWLPFSAEVNACINLADLPTSPSNGATYAVCDADLSSATPCATSDAVLGEGLSCRWNGDTSAWEPSDRVTLQRACETGDVCGWDNLTSSNPLVTAPAGLDAVRERVYNESGEFIRECVFGADPGTPCAPTPIVINPGNSFCVQAVMDDPATILNLECYENVDTLGVGTSVVKTPAPFACSVFTDVDATDDTMLLIPIPHNVTVASVYCHYQGSAPATPAEFALVGMTHTAPTCAGPTAAATPQLVTASGNVAAFVPIRVSVGNTPNPATDTYEVCLTYQPRIN